MHGLFSFFASTAVKTYTCEQLYDMEKSRRVNDGFVYRMLGIPQFKNSLKINPGDLTRREIQLARYQQKCSPREILPLVFTGVAIFLLGIILFFINRKLGYSLIAVGAFVILFPVLYYFVSGRVAYLKNKHREHNTKKGHFNLYSRTHNYRELDMDTGMDVDMNHGMDSAVDEGFNPTFDY